MNFFLSAAIHTRTGQNVSLCAEQKHFSLTFWQEGQGSLRQAIMCVYSYRQCPSSDYRNRSNRQQMLKSKKQIQHSQILLFPDTRLDSGQATINFLRELPCRSSNENSLEIKLLGEFQSLSLPSSSC